VCYNCSVIKIVTAPNPVLSAIAKPVSKVDSSVIKLVEEMKKVLVSTTDPKGVGLAAPQVGKPLQIFIAKPTDKSKILVFINPKITERSLEQSLVKRPKKNHVDGLKDENESDSKKLEGCLSLPTIWGPVLRASSLTLTFLDEQGVSHKQKFTNFMATIIQHEVDHLTGILFPKRVLEQKGTLYKSHKNKKGEDEFEEIEI
jgi:peptide deformylase